ncbi:MAG: hypothetical protein ACMG6E_01965 [Candidatus Roizmanbacteria bacterium]
MKVQESWSLQSLITHAYHRTKDRLWSYIGVELGLFLAFIGIIAVVTITVIPLLMTNNSSLIIALLIPISIIAIAILAYVMTWFQLVMVDVIINKANHGVKASFASMKHHVIDFFKYNILATIFMIGLFPFGIFTFFAIMILWLFWSSFSAFIFLEQKKRGLEVLWASKVMISQKFWEIALRFVAVTGIIWMISYILSSSNNAGLHLILFIFDILIAPFMLSYSYEIYKQLDEPKKISEPKLWVGLSVIGWILILAIGLYGINGLSHMNFDGIRKGFEKEMPKYPASEVLRLLGPKS